MSDKSEIKSSKSSLDADKLSQKRRALIKGSAVALPAILTFRNASAIPFVVSASCSVKLKTSGIDRESIAATQPSSGSNDGWVRVPTKLSTLTKVVTAASPGTETINVFSQDSVKWFADTTNTLSAEYFSVSSTNPTKMVKIGGSTPGTEYTYSAFTDGVVLIQIDNAGAVIAYGKASTTGGFPYASSSCWTSLGHV
jgi:hypothetical protein